MFNYLFLLFITTLNNLKLNTILQWNNGYDNRNLTIHNEDIENLTIIFNKYELLKKLQSNESTIHQKLDLIDENLKIEQFNIFNGGLLQDWNFE